MGKYIIKDATGSINSVDLSDRIAEVTVNMSADDVDVSTMGTGVHQHAAGLRNDSYVFKFLQDFDAGKVDATLAPLVSDADNEPSFPVSVSPFSTGASATNPHYTCEEGILLDYQPIQGAIGSRSEADVTIPANDSITRGTT